MAQLRMVGSRVFRQRNGNVKAIVLTSTNLRHRYFAKTIASHFEVVGVFTEAKRNYYTSQREESTAVQTHFSHLSRAEKEWFAIPDSEAVPDLIEVDDINASEVVEKALSLEADCISLFGTAILKPIWLDAFKDRIINLHLGLSPYYRGSATLFWPFVYHELQYLGTTIHLAVEKVDAGAILRRVQPELIPGEDYYAITNRLICDSMKQMPDVISRYLHGEIEPKPQENVEGSRLCKKADFSKNALQKMLKYAGQGLIEAEINEIMEARCHFSL